MAPAKVVAAHVLVRAREGFHVMPLMPVCVAVNMGTAMLKDMIRKEVGGQGIRNETWYERYSPGLLGTGFAMLTCA